MSEIDMLRDLATSCTVATDKERVQSSGNDDKISSVVAKIIDIESETNDIVTNMISVRQHIISQLESMDNQLYYDFLHRKYVQMMTYEQIAYDMDISLRQTYRVHNSALMEFEQQFGGEYLDVALIVR